MSNPPVSVRVTQFLLWLWSIGAIISVFLPGRRTFNPAPGWTPEIRISIVITIALILVGFALWGIHQQKPYGRWLSLVFLLLLVVGGLARWDESGAIGIIVKALMQGQLPPIEGRLIDDFVYDNSYPIYRGYLALAGHALIDALSLLLWTGLPSFLAIRLIVAPEVKRFFSRN
jgi:hypothetical protein